MNRARGKSRSSHGTARTLPGSPFLTKIGLDQTRVADGKHPFTCPAVMRGLPLELDTPITFLVGENGSGKSTLLEGLAWALGFSAFGGDRSRSYAEGSEGHDLGRALALEWRQPVRDGFFLRAETFFNWVRYMEDANSLFTAYGGRSLNSCSHGEAFLALFDNRFEDGIYLLDEPEAALSPSRQLSFLTILHRLGESRCAQLLIATHSPILLALPGATVLQVDDCGLRRVDYRETEHFRLARDFLNAPQRFLRHLLETDDSDAGRSDS